MASCGRWSGLSGGAWCERRRKDLIIRNARRSSIRRERNAIPLAGKTKGSRNGIRSRIGRANQPRIITAANRGIRTRPGGAGDKGWRLDQI